MQDRKSIERFLRTQPYAASTTRNYRDMLVRLHGWLAGRDIRFERLTVEEMGDYLDDHDWGLATKNLALAAARAYARYVSGADHPILAMRLPKPQPKPGRTLTLAEVRQLLNAIDTHSPIGVRNYALYLLWLDTGLRVSEMCRLDVGDVDLEKMLAQALVKGGRWELAAFTPETRTWLELWLTLRPQYAAEGERALFVGIAGNTPGQRMTRYGLKTNLNRLAKRAGLAGTVSPHALRRTMATIATEANAAPMEIVRRMGRWRSDREIRRYTAALSVESIRPYLPVRALFGSAPISISKADADDDPGAPEDS
jgi:site-specific recombinase XerD